MNRRDFLRLSLATSALAVATASAAPASGITPAHLPRWRGFNLLEKFVAETKKKFVETDFAWMQEWGFDFVRLPLDYRCWAKQTDWLTIDDAELKDIDEAVAFGKKYGVHVNISFHRAPGFSVNQIVKEPASLWDSEDAQAAFALHWRTFANRYKGVPNTRVSFNLVNEPDTVPEEKYVRAATRAIEAIRAEDPNRLIIADGLMWARLPVKSLVPLHVAQSTRGYEPMRISHYHANWIGGADKWETPNWPLKVGDDVFDKERLRKAFAPWKAIEEQGTGVHVGEWGAHNQTPHDVVLAWMQDCLDLWKDAGWGWALWNLRGSFGVVDSGRTDAQYEDFQGHKLDRKMLELLQSN